MKILRATAHLTRTGILSSLTVATLFFPFTPSAVRADEPKITILATGGTIAGAQADPNEPGYKAGSFSVEDLVKAVPPLKNVADIDGVQVSNIGSQNMHDAIWLKLLRETTKTLAKPDVDGVVITHGTDTLEETAYFLNLTLKSDKPVILVGSMRPATSISADGPMNIYNAVVVASSSDAVGHGVLMVMNDEIHYAAEFTKTNTTNPDTMKSPNRGLAGVCDTGECVFFSPTEKRHTTKSEFSISDDVTELPNVAIIYAHANMGKSLIEAAINSGAKGIVVAGVGDGNMTDPALEALTEAAKNGIVVVRSSRVGSGVVRRNVEVDDDKLGFVAAQELNPQKARILLQLALMQTSEPKTIQRMFDEY
jgi:L-asparaginase